MKAQKIQIETVAVDNFEGIKVAVQNGSNVYTFNSGFCEEEQDMGGYIPVTSRIGKSTPVLKNGKYYLPWHVAAALGNNGEGDSWIESVSAEEAIQTLQSLKREYDENFSTCVTSANSLAGTYVY